MDKKEFFKRFGTLFMAILFLVTSVGVTAIAFWQSKNDSSQDTSQQALEEAMQQANQGQEDTCNIAEQLPAPAEAVPEAFKPEGDVTELKVEDIEKGTGRVAEDGNCLVVKYNGTLAADGTQFDGNFDADTAIQFRLGAGMVIPGWDQGLVGMAEGGTRRLIIPSELAYGEAGGGDIPPNADLVFTVKLIEVKD